MPSTPHTFLLLQTRSIHWFYYIQTTKMTIVANQVYTLVLTANENDYSTMLVCLNHVWTRNLILIPNL